MAQQKTPSDFFEKSESSQKDRLLQILLTINTDGMLRYGSFRNLFYVYPPDEMNYMKAATGLLNLMIENKILDKSATLEYCYLFREQDKNGLGNCFKLSDGQIAELKTFQDTHKKIEAIKQTLNDANLQPNQKILQLRHYFPDIDKVQAIDIVLKHIKEVVDDSKIQTNDKLSRVCDFLRSSCLNNTM